MTVPSGVGVAVPWQSESVLSASKVRAAIAPKWWYNYLSNHVGDPGYVPMLWRPTPGDAQWNAAVQDAKTTGRLYLLFNEPEYSGQSNTPATVAATICNQWQAATRRYLNGKWTVTPWAGLGLLVNDAGIDKSLKYAEDYLNAGGRVPPVWHIHIYAHDGNHWDALWRRWANWIYENKAKYRGLQRPVIVTECASWSTDPARQLEVMQRASAIMQDWTLLRGVAWFSSLYGPYRSEWKRSDAFQFQVSGESITSSGALTTVGNGLKQLNAPTNFFPLASSEGNIEETTHGAIPE